MNTPQKGCSFPKFPKFTLELPFLLQFAPKVSLLLRVVSNVESFFHLFPRSKHNVHTILLYATRLCFLCLLDSANKDVSCTSSMVVHFLIVWYLSRGVSFLFLTSFLFFFGDVKTGFSWKYISRTGSSKRLLQRTPPPPLIPEERMLNVPCIKCSPCRYTVQGSNNPLLAQSPRY